MSAVDTICLYLIAALPAVLLAVAAWCLAQTQEDDR